MNNVVASRKYVWPAAIVIAALYFGPSIMRFFVPGNGVARQVAVKPPASIPVGLGFTATPKATSSPATVAPGQYLGAWFGGLSLPNRGACKFRLELSGKDDKDNPVAGYSSLSCTPSAYTLLAGRHGRQTPAAIMEAMTKQMNPTSAILSGAPKGTGVEFHADQNIGVNEIKDGCPISTLTTTPFGADQLAVEWKESGQGLCQGAQLVLRRIPR